MNMGVNKSESEKSLDTEIFEQGFPVPRVIFILEKKKKQFTYSL